MLIADTGPLVAVINRRDQFHAWAVETLKRTTEPLHTCEAVLTEAFFRLTHVPGGPDRLLDLLTIPDFMVLDWRVHESRDEIRTIMKKYADTPASFADACLVSMAESSRRPVVWTTDSHFRIYRIRGGKQIQVLAP